MRLSVEAKTVISAVTMTVLLAGTQSSVCAANGEESTRSSDKSMEEWNAYYHPAPDEPSYKNAKSDYMRKLSPGGRVFFLANRKDFAEALVELEKLPKKDTGSALYAKAVCLDGLKRYSEAVQCFADAQSKIDLIFQPGPKFYIHYATALFHARQYAKAMKYLDIAESMGKQSAAKGNKEPMPVTDTVFRRKAILRELQSHRMNADLVQKSKIDFGMFFSTISMHDVPQLVLQKDVDLHNVSMEVNLDSVDYLHNPFSEAAAKKKGGKIPPVDTKLLTVAREMMTQNRFGECYSALDGFIDANIAEGAAPVEYYIRGYKFADEYLYKVRMLQLGAGLAAGRSNMGLSLRGNFNTDQSKFWISVENRLLGRETSLPSAVATGAKSDAALVSWCRYAIAVRALSKKNYKLAAEEFGKVKLNGTRDKDLLLFSNVLKEFCEKRK